MDILWLQIASFWPLELWSSAGGKMNEVKIRRMIWYVYGVNLLLLIPNIM